MSESDLMELLGEYARRGESPARIVLRRDQYTTLAHEVSERLAAYEARRVRYGGPPYPPHPARSGSMSVAAPWGIVEIVPGPTTA